MNLVVNIHADTAFAREVVKERLIPGQFHVLDFMGTFPLNSPGIFHSREMDPGNSIEFASIRNYIAAIGKLSMEQVEDGIFIRDIKVNGLPVFWLTPLAEKHPGHWGSLLFFFLEFLKRKSSFFDEYEHIRIISPVDPEEMIAAVQTVRPTLKIHPKEVYHLSKKTSSGESSLDKMKKFMKNYWRCRNRKSSAKPEEINPEEYRTILINHTDGNLVEFASQKFVYALLQQHSKVLYVNLHLLFTQRHQDPVSELPLQLLPSLTDILKLGRKLYRKNAQLTEMVNRNREPKYWFMKLALKEMLEVTRQVPLFFYHLWMKRFLAAMPSGAKVFYENECCIPGRIITHAIKSSNSRKEAIAYQHGYISLNHTVYRFDHDELRSLPGDEKDAVPFPDKILLWGDHFKKQLAAHIPVDPSRLQVAGSPRHQHFRRMFPDGIDRNAGAAPRKFLWCTSSPAFAEAEWEIFYPAIKNIPGVSLEIRMHPRHDLLKKLKQLTAASGLDVSFQSTENLEDQLPGIDVVICHAQSSVFLDALNVGMPVIRIFTPLVKSIVEITELDSLYNVASSYECMQAISRLSMPVTNAHRQALSELIGPSDPVGWEITLRN